MPTKTLLVLDQLLLEAVSDYISVATTTNITTDNSIISTNLNSYDMSRNDIFNGWWVYLNTANNTTVDRMVSDYATSTDTLTIYGAALSSESGAQTIRLSRYSWADRTNAIIRAIEEIYPSLHLKLENTELITGNILPPFNWTSTTVLEKWASTNLTSTTKATPPSQYVRRGATSAKAIASSAGGYLSIHSDKYPRLLDIMGKTVTAKVWALPEEANDGAIVIYTKQADGTEQTLTSSTTNPAGEFTLLEKKDQDINDDLVEAEVRLKVVTNAKYVYFDPPRLIGKDLQEYILPLDFKNGNVEQVDIQTSGYSSDWCDDIRPYGWRPIYGTEIIEDGTDKWLRLPYLYPSKYQIRLRGRKKLETLVATTDSGTITLDKEERVNLLIAYAAYKLFKIVKGLPAHRDVSRYDDLANEWLREYYRLLPKMRMQTGSLRMNLPAI